MATPDPDSNVDAVSGHEPRRATQRRPGSRLAAAKGVRYGVNNGGGSSIRREPRAAATEGARSGANQANRGWPGGTGDKLVLPIGGWTWKVMNHERGKVVAHR